MPAIIEPEVFSAWLDVDGVDADEALLLLRPAPEAALELVEVGRQRGQQDLRRWRNGETGAGSQLRGLLTDSLHRHLLVSFVLPRRFAVGIQKPRAFHTSGQKR